MEKSKKSKKKLIGIIAGCAMAFVLTVVVSVAVTLAYFGDKGNASSSITMGEALEFKTGISATVGGSTDAVTNALPGQPADIVISGTVKQSSTRAFFVVELSIATNYVGDEESELSVPTINDAVVKFGTAEQTTKVYTDSDNSKTYLYVGTDDDKCSEVDFSAAGDTAFTITIKYTIPKTATNASAGEKITISAEASIIQSKYLGTGDNLNTSAITDVITALKDINNAE